MALFAFLGFGIMFGAIAAALLPYRAVAMWTTVGVGIVGAEVLGVLGCLLLGDPLDSFWNLGPWLFSIAGAVCALWVWTRMGQKAQHPDRR